jgi:hypothetical protein
MGYRGGQFGTQASSLERGLASLIIKSIGSTNCFPGDTLSTAEQRRLPDAHHSQEKSMVLRMRRIFQIVLLSGLTACGLVSSNAATVKNPIFGYELTTDVVYGQGAVTKDGEVVDRDLLIDVYTPTDESLTGPFPAVILVHGGSYQIGGLRAPPHKEAGAVHSRTEDWARLLTPLGYVCFVIDYRLVPELPIPKTDMEADNIQDFKKSDHTGWDRAFQFVAQQSGAAPA